MFLSAQLSLYPLRQPRLSPAISEAVEILKQHGLSVKPGEMSSQVTGDDETLFAALKDIFRKQAEQGDIVMVVTLSNACPVS